MSFAFVNGIVLQHCQLIRHRKTNEMVGPNLARVRHDVTVRGRYNPALASYVFASAGGQSAFGPIFRPGLGGPVTEQSVQWALQQPRKPFAFVAGGVMIVFGPKPITARVLVPAPPIPGFLGGLLSGVTGTDLKPVIKQKFGFADCNNGPVCSADVIENIGDKTFQVEWTVTTWVNDAPAPNLTGAALGGAVGAAVGGVTPATIKFPTPPLLANEYEMVHTIDQDFFTMRHVRGRAVFRSDVMQALRLFPDQLRYWLGLPVPPRFRREQISVRQLSDGLTTEYRYIDRERVLNFDPNIFTRVEVTYSQDTEKLGMETLLRNGFMTGYSALTGINASSRTGGLMSGHIGDILRRRSTFFGIGAGLAMAAFAGLPVTNHHVVARFWGHAQQNRDYLETTAADTLVELMRANLVAAPAAATVQPIPFSIPVLFGGGFNVQFGDMRTQVTSDWSGMFYEIRMDWIGSRLQTIVGPLLNRLRRGGAPPRAAGRQVRAILIDPMRGTYLGGAVASALRDSADLWAPPAAPPDVTDTEVDRSGTTVVIPLSRSFVGPISAGVSTTISGTVTTRPGPPAVSGITLP